MTLRKVKLSVLLFAATLAVLTAAYAGVPPQQQPPAGQPDKPAEEVYRNIQIFKGLPSQGLVRAMGFFTRSLGVQCVFCHIPPTFEKDDKPEKLAARNMYKLVRLLQKEVGANKISCYTCHRGHPEPEPMPADWKAEFEKSLAEADKDKTPAEKVYGNIQVLKGVPAGRIMVIMAMFTRALGVECSHCHVEGEFDKDEKAAKQTARKMLTMTGTIAGEIFEGKSTVNCYTCHRGQKEPVTFPPPQAPPAPKRS
jgi:hypothetical protein